MENQLLEQGDVIVVLGEPGAGKTRLLQKLAERSGGVFKDARSFRHQGIRGAAECLIIDALDELAKLDESGLDELFVKARETGAKQAIFSSRSSEWEEAREITLERFFGKRPTVVRLRPFNENEQKELFSHQFPDEDFDNFKAEVEKFDLHPLLGNPQFLQLFGEAYIENGRKFNSKHQIFEDAIQRLARMPVNGVSQKTSSTLEERIAWAGEIFAKLLLSGAAGVDVTDNANALYPRLASLVKSDGGKVAEILDTQLFKPAGEHNRHDPVHRIVAEYCAARYLAARIDDPADPLSMRRCLAFIAPNGVVRDDLRGLLGWMAAVGGDELQRKAIELDPYAVLAHGDPSRLSPSSKKLLIQALTWLAEKDPFFRRGDVWRTFSTAGFFTPDVIDMVRPMLGAERQSAELTGLFLELLAGSEAIPHLETELRNLVLDTNETPHNRELARRRLMAIPGIDLAGIFKALISEGTENTLYMAARIFEEAGIEKLGRDNLLALLNETSALPQFKTPHYEWELHARYLVDHYIPAIFRDLDLATVVWLLDQLIEDLHCSCGAESIFQCHCRDALSIIVSALLDRYFETTPGPYQPEKIWRWARNLVFHEHADLEKSLANRVLQTNHGLRQGIHRLVLGHLTDAEQVRKIRFDAFTDIYAYPGLQFQPGDWKALADHAFEIDNLALWEDCIIFHNPGMNKNKRGPESDLRRHMRAQANEKPAFMREWARSNRQWKASRHETMKRRTKLKLKRQRRELRADEKNRKNFKKNYAKIENGRYFWWLVYFARFFLKQAEEIPEWIDSALPERTLLKCLPFIEPHLPTLKDLAKLRCSLKGLHIVKVLTASCLAHFRRNGHLNDISREMLAIIKTNMDLHIADLNDDEEEAFEREVNHRLFGSIDDVEQFARDYIEEQLKIKGRPYTDVDWLRYKEEFRPLQQTLAFEWLKKYPSASLSTISTLFDLSIPHADKAELQGLIIERCEKILKSPLVEDTENMTEARKFWFLRHFFFVEKVHERIWEWIASDPDNILLFEGPLDRFERDTYANWPILSAEKIYRIMDVFIEKWPKVPLPDSWGTSSPRPERAYRLLNDITWRLAKNEPERSLPVLERMLFDNRFKDFHRVLKHLQANALRKLALKDVTTPKPSEIIDALEQKAVATVEELRALIIDNLERLQAEITGGEFNTAGKYYNGSERVDENTARDRIAEHLQAQLSPLGISVTPEHHLRGDNRCDMTFSIMEGGSRKLLVMEVKGQWNRELFTAAKAQLHERYAIHPDAAEQGIYLVLWFGWDEKIAGTKNRDIAGPAELRQKVMDKMPQELKGRIDVFVLDLSRRTMIR